MVEDLEGAHEGETVFILGTGPGLNELDEDRSAALSEKTTIGLNLAFYKHLPSYFISAHPSAIALAELNNLPQKGVCCIKLGYKGVGGDGFRFVEKAWFEGRLPHDGSLRTKKNVSLAATHLAYVFKPARVVYVGVEMENHLHFFSTNDDLRQKILSDLAKIIPANGSKGLKLDIELTRNEITGTVDFYSHEPFYPMGSWMSADRYRKTFVKYKAILEGAGIEVFTSSRTGALNRAKVQHIDIDEAISG